MARKFEELRAEMAPERRARIDAAVQEMDAELHLGDLRKARELTQAQMASALGVAQSEVSKIEHRADVYVGTLRRFIEAMGGELRIMADFGDAGAVEISQFADVG